ncbi:MULTISPECIES: hypothetical protein [Delftia]|jgi:hypothetical protein|uniref:Flagellar transcriptional activator FlhD n=2 Tax=Delftia TaxID=80865 RepID=A0A1H3NAP0_9BURK|nr:MULTISPECIES: hypothetical protein [Delftia]QPS78311.1 hypothetical protein I6G48_31805 [Delftia acidovorans]QPS84872.1 hypothetical protein I6G47_32480 [Delftia lacustris]SDY85926.1 hypothetical protein SAMN05421547_108248 [Delftia lacustris]
MQDAAILNRNFLLQAREAAKKPEGGLTTGLSPTMLKRIGDMTNAEIEQFSQLLPITMFTLRVDTAALDRILETSKTKPVAAASYLVSALAR